jgi:proliferating cell nuclear antigen
MKILRVVTEHTAPIKILFEVLKDMLVEANIECIADQNNNKIKKNDDDDDEVEQSEDVTESENKNKKNKGCIKINAIDPTKSVLINLKLDATNFNVFDCKKNKLVLGVNLGIFYKLIKSMGKSDILELSVDHDDKNSLGIKIDSPDDKKDTEIKMKLLDLNETKMSIPEITFDAVITMESQEFNKLCREMNNIADHVEIKCLSDKIIFTCKGEYANKKTTYRTQTSDDDNEHVLVSISHGCTKSINGKPVSPQIVQGVFELKNLVLFAKCASLCNDIEIYMKNNFPLVIKYTVATLGRILLCLSPTDGDETKNANYCDEEEFYSDED